MILLPSLLSDLAAGLGDLLALRSTSTGPDRGEGLLGPGRDMMISSTSESLEDPTDLARRC